MTTAVRKPLSGVRLSEAARCLRCCALRGKGAEPTPATQQEERRMNRGRVLGRMVAQEFARKYGADDVEVEREIVWPLGVGHADIYIRSQRLIVEVFSTTGTDYTAKMRQAKRYLHFDAEAEAAAVYVLDVKDLSREEVFPVFVTDDDAASIRAEVDMLQAAIDGTGPLPDCVHATPAGCRMSGCAFTDTAWEGWQPPDPVDLSDTPALVAGAAAFYRADKTRRERKALFEEAEAEYQRAKEMLVEVLPVGRPVKAGPLELKRTLRKGSETFSLSKARSAGVWTPAHDDVFGPFMKVGDSVSLVSVKRVTDEPVEAADFGEVPF